MNLHCIYNLTSGYLRGRNQNLNSVLVLVCNKTWHQIYSRTQDLKDCTKTNIWLTFVLVVEALHRLPSPPWVCYPQSWHQMSLHSPLCLLFGPRLPPGTGPVLAASEASWPNFQFPPQQFSWPGEVGFRMIQTSLPLLFTWYGLHYMLSQSPHLFQMFITMLVPSCRQFALEMLTLWLPIAYWLSLSSPVPPVTLSSLLTQLHTLHTPATGHSHPQPGHCTAVSCLGIEDGSLTWQGHTSA